MEFQSFRTLSRKLAGPSRVAVVALVVASAILVGVAASTSVGVQHAQAAPYVLSGNPVSSHLTTVPQIHISHAGQSCPDGICFKVAAEIAPDVVAPAIQPAPKHTTKKSSTSTHTSTPKNATGKKTTQPSNSGGGSVNSGGGSGCAPAVSLPAAVVSAVNAHLSGCNAAALLWIIKHESGGNPNAVNAKSGAYGLGQALPRSKIAPFGPINSIAAQVAWMIAYVNSRYGGPQQAYHFWVAHHWY